jgi:hypothetical protein
VLDCLGTTHRGGVGEGKFSLKSLPLYLGGRPQVCIRKDAEWTLLVVWTVCWESNPRRPVRRPSMYPLNYPHTLLGVAGRNAIYVGFVVNKVKMRQGFLRLSVIIPPYSMGPVEPELPSKLAECYHFLSLSFRPHHGSGAYSASNRDEYGKTFLWVKLDRHVKPKI